MNVNRIGVVGRISLGAVTDSWQTSNRVFQLFQPPAPHFPLRNNTPSNSYTRNNKQTNRISLAAKIGFA